MTRRYRLPLCSALLLLLAGALTCTRKPSSSSPGGGAPGAGAGPVAYDPAKDPLVNPRKLLEPLPDKPETIATGETLVRNVDGNPTSLNPLMMSSTYEFYLADVLFDSLFSFDDKMEWFVNTDMVEKFEESDDRLVNTVRLKPGLKWQDGHPLTARDVRFSWEIILKPEVPCPAVKVGTDEITDVKIIDDLTFQFIHKQALPTNKWNVLFPIIPEHIWGKPEELKQDPTISTSDYYIRHSRDVIIGCGAYKLVKWVANDHIEVERWEEYHGEKPRFKRQIFKIVPDQNTTLQLFKRGELDEMRLSSQQFATQTNDAAFGKVGVKGFSPEWGYSYICWNVDGKRNPFFTDARVRRAMAHALNIPLLIRTIGYNLVTPCYGIFHPDSWMFNPEVKRIEFDLAAAAKLLDEAGWKLDPNEGYRYKTIDGKPVKFEFSLLIPQGSPTGPKVAAQYEQDLRRIGVSLKTQVTEWANFMKSVRGHEFQASIASWGTGTDPDTQWNLWRSDQIDGGRNYPGFRNERVDRLFELARAEFDQEKRAGYYREIQKIIYDEQPYLFLWNINTLWAFNNRLRGIQFSPRGVFNFHPSHLRWWVHKNEQLYKG